MNFHNNFDVRMTLNHIYVCDLLDLEYFDFTKVQYIFATVPIISLIQKEAAGEDLKMGLILTHAEDQMMSAEVFKVMAEEMIELYKKVDGLR